MVRKLFLAVTATWNLVGLGLFIGLFTAAEYFFGNDFVSTIVSGLFISMAVLVGIVYGPTVIDYLRKTRRIHYLATGVFALFLSVGISRVWAITYIYLERPDWMTRHWFPTFCFMIAASTGFFFLRAPDNLPNHQYKSWRYLLAAMILTVLVTSTVIVIGASIYPEEENACYNTHNLSNSQYYLGGVER